MSPPEVCILVKKNIFTFLKGWFFGPLLKLSLPNTVNIDVKIEEHFQAPATASLTFTTRRRGQLNHLLQHDELEILFENFSKCKLLCVPGITKISSDLFSVLSMSVKEKPLCTVLVSWDRVQVRDLDCDKLTS